MAVSDDITLRELFREVPIRTTLASVVPLSVGIAQLLDGVVHGVPVVRVVGFTAGMVIAAVLATQYNLVTFRREKIERELFEEDGEEKAD